MVNNAERTLVASLRRYAASTGCALQLIADDWIVVLSRGNDRHVIMGYDLGLNNSAAMRVANDKGATFDVLHAAGIPALEHRVFLHPRFLEFAPAGGNWPGLLSAFEAFGGDGVLKDNEGTGGLEVFRVRTLAELEQRAHQLFQIARSIALSPYVAIGTETRFVMLGDDCLLAYAKQRPAVLGDGRRTIGELIAAAPGQAVDNPDIALTDIPPAGKSVPLQWRHNLGLGATALRLDAGESALAPGLALARQTMAALTLRFAAIDIITSGGQGLVLEANAGVMLEAASRPGFGGAELADRIYHRALDEIMRPQG